MNRFALRFLVLSALGLFLGAGAKPQTASQAVVESTLETVAIASKERRVIYHTKDHIEAPNWSRDGKWLAYASGTLTSDVILISDAGN